MIDNLLQVLHSHNLAVSDLQFFTGANRQNATQLYHGILWDENGQNQPIFIKRLISPFSETNYQQLCQEIATLQACQSLAIDGKDKKQLYGVPKLLAFNTDKNCPFLITTFYQGKMLKTLLQKDKLNFDQKITLTISVCHLLKKFHCLGYLHGDIKLSNIFITSSNQLILLDFGLSRNLQNPMINANSTSGTPTYMSPEQFNGLALTTQSDFYSLGIVLFELFFGQLPFDADDLHGWAVAHCQQPIPNLATLDTAKDFSHHQLKTLQIIFELLLAKVADKRCDTLQPIIELLAKLAF